MANIVETRSTFLVRWRDAETGRRLSSSVPWGVGPEPISKEQARAEAERLRARMAQNERAAKRSHAAAVATGGALGFVDYIGPGEEALRFEARR